MGDSRPLRYIPPMGFLRAAALLVLGIATIRAAQPPKDMFPGQTAHTFHLERLQVLDAGYLLFLPDGYGQDPARRWPLILFLHGAGERGDDIWRVAIHGPPKVDTVKAGFPFVVVSPQCPEGRTWSNDLLLALLDEVEAQYAVDPHRVYLTGLSMGGYGTWSLGLSHPERFAAIAPICGGGAMIGPMLADRKPLASLPVWAFHGAKDPVVPVEESRRMVRLLQRLGARDVKLTVYPDAGHDSWTRTYADPELYAWFLKHTR